MAPWSIACRPKEGFNTEEIKELCALKPCYLCRNLAVSTTATKMHGLDKVDYKGLLPYGKPNARVCCPRCNMGKGQYSLESHEAHLILQLTTMQCPVWRAANGLPPKPKPLPACFYELLR